MWRDRAGWGGGHGDVMGSQGCLETCLRPRLQAHLWITGLGQPWEGAGLRSSRYVKGSSCQLELRLKVHGGELALSSCLNHPPGSGPGPSGGAE